MYIIPRVHYPPSVPPKSRFDPLFVRRPLHISYISVKISSFITCTLSPRVPPKCRFDPLFVRLPLHISYITVTNSSFITCTLSPCVHYPPSVYFILARRLLRVSCARSPAATPICPRVAPRVPLAPRSVGFFTNALSQAQIIFFTFTYLLFATFTQSDCKSHGRRAATLGRP